MSQIQTLSDMNHAHLVALKTTLDDIRIITLTALGVGITNMAILAVMFSGKL
jgi:hypothetical protein